MLLIYIAVESADKIDANALMPAIKETEDRAMAPKELLADSLYGSGDNIRQAKQNHNVDVVAPVMGVKSKGLDLDDFLLDPDRKIILCPQGNSPISVKRPRDRFIAKFLCSDCQECP